MTYICLRCIGGCGNALFGGENERFPTEDPDEITGSADGIYVCVDCEVKAADHPWKEFAPKEADVIKDTSVYSNWTKHMLVER